MKLMRSKYRIGDLVCIKKNMEEKETFKGIPLNNAGYLDNKTVYIVTGVEIFKSREPPLSFRVTRGGRLHPIERIDEPVEYIRYLIKELIQNNSEGYAVPEIALVKFKKIGENNESYK